MRRFKVIRPESAKVILFILPFLFSGIVQAHLCDNVFRQADKLIVKPESYNLVVKDKTDFKIFLQNNMDRGIAEISLLADSPAFDFDISPSRMSIPKDQRVYFKVTMSPKKAAKTGNYPIDFRLVGGGRQFKSFSLNMDSKASDTEKSKQESFYTSPGKTKASKNENHPGKTNHSNLLKIPRVAQRPELDGAMDEPMWKKAGIASNFNSSEGGQAVYQTICLAAHDEKNMFLGLYCFDENGVEQTAQDKVEIRISASRTGYPYYAIVVPAASNPFYKKSPAQGEFAPWNPLGAEYHASDSEDSWSAEILMPFSVMGLSPPSSGKSCFFRIERVKSSGNSEKSYWAQDSSGYNSEDGFGEIIVQP